MPITLTRRQALSAAAGSLAACAGLTSLNGCAAGDSPARSTAAADPSRNGEGLDFFVLLSDPHISSNPEEAVRGVNMHQRLSEQVAQLVTTDDSARSAPAPCVLINGDLILKSDLDEVACYRNLVEILDPLIRPGHRVTLTVGNHDLREVFLAVLADAQTQAPADLPPVTALPHRHVHVIPAAYGDWYLLDSLVGVKQTPGTLDPLQLQWLDRELDARGDRPALVMVHHTPQFPDSDSFYGLTNTPEFLSLLNRHPNVSGLFFGHAHAWRTLPAGELLPSFPEDHTLARSPFPIIGLPSTAYVFDDSQPAGRVLCRLGPGGFTVKLEAVDPAHPQHGRLLSFPWRS